MEPRKYSRLLVPAAVAILPAAVTCTRHNTNRERGMTVAIGPANADVINTDSTAIQKAVDRAAAAVGRHSVPF